MNKHSMGFRVMHLYYGCDPAADRYVFWEPALSRFVRRFLDTSDEVIGVKL